LCLAYGIGLCLFIMSLSQQSSDVESKQLSHPLGDIVDLCAKSIPESNMPARMETAFAIRMGGILSLEELETAFEECNAAIDEYINSENVRLPFVAKTLLRFRLRVVFVVRRGRLLSQMIPE